MRIALVHEFLSQLGGAEKVLQVFHEMFPEAPVYVLAYDREKAGNHFKGWDIRASFIQKLPFGSRHYRWYFWLMPKAAESFDFRDYDVVISNSSAYAKGIVVGPETLHICYCHTPTRYLWSDRDYVSHLAKGKIRAAFLAPVLAWLRYWDKKAAGRPDKIVANSQFVAGRIRNYYGRESQVIYPPTDTGKFFISEKTGDYFLLVSRLKQYKRVGLAIRAFNELGLPLKIIGQGEEGENLKKIARGNIEFLGWVSEENKAKYLSQCLALIHPQAEDFGLTPVEAMASGRPVIAYNEGGALETVIEGKTGLFFSEQNVCSLIETIRNFKPGEFDSEEIRRHAEKFGQERFEREFRELMESSAREKGILQE